MSTKNCNHHAHEGPAELPVTEFHKDKHAKDGLCSMCKVCARRKMNQRRKDKATDPVYLQQRKEAGYRYRHGRGKSGQLYNAAMQRARKAGLEFTITKEDIVIPDVCPVLGIPIIPGKGRVGDGLVGALDTSPSVDRIDNSKGYIPGNIMVISWRANYLKNNASLDELILLAEYAWKIKRRLESQAERGK